MAYGTEQGSWYENRSKTPYQKQLTPTCSNQSKFSFLAGPKTWRIRKLCLLESDQPRKGCLSQATVRLALASSGEDAHVGIEVR